MNTSDIEERLQALEKAVALQARLIQKLGQLGEAHQRSLETLAVPVLQSAELAPLTTVN